MARTLNLFARGLGVVAGLVLAFAWAFAVWVPTAGLTLSGVSFVTALLLLGFALFAAVASAYGHATVVALLFLVSFFPVGAFLLTAPHWLRFTGFADLALLAAAALLFATARAARPKPTAAGS